MRYEKIPSLSDWANDSASISSRGRVAAMVAAQGRAVPALNAAPKTELKAINDLIGLYDKAFSLMAKRNLIMDLGRAITVWEQKNPGAQPLAMAALKEVVGRQLQTIPFAVGHYTDVICAGWAIGCNYSVGTGVTSANSAENPDYFRHSENDTADMSQKCTDMVGAVRAARNAISVNNLVDNDHTLKIFMAPEFYFRGKNGAYSPEIVSEILPRLVKDLGPGWNDWLFVFGTAVASIEDEVTYCQTCGYGNSKIKFERISGDRSKTQPKCERDASHLIGTKTFGADVQNVALVYHAGESHMVAKEYVSQIDYKSNKVGPKGLDALAPQGGSKSRITSLHTDERMGGCILTIAGLTVGIEICKDHDEKGGRASKLKGNIQVLLIPSFGMNIGNVLNCRQGGVVFNVDGGGNGDSEVKLRSRAAPPARISVAHARGSLHIWSPAPLPQ